jgi:hypothetical protein
MPYRLQMSYLHPALARWEPAAMLRAAAKICRCPRAERTRSSSWKCGWPVKKTHARQKLCENTRFAFAASIAEMSRSSVCTECVVLPPGAITQAQTHCRSRPFKVDGAVCRLNDPFLPKPEQQGLFASPCRSCACQGQEIDCQDEVDQKKHYRSGCCCW